MPPKTKRTDKGGEGSDAEIDASYPDEANDEALQDLLKAKPPKAAPPDTSKFGTVESYESAGRGAETWVAFKLVFVAGKKFSEFKPILMKMKGLELLGNFPDGCDYCKVKVQVQDTKKAFGTELNEDASAEGDEVSFKGDAKTGKVFSLDQKSKGFSAELKPFVKTISIDSIVDSGVNKDTDQSDAQYNQAPNAYTHDVLMKAYRVPKGLRPHFGPTGTINPVVWVIDKNIAIEHPLFKGRKIDHFAFDSDNKKINRGPPNSLEEANVVTTGAPPLNLFPKKDHGAGVVSALLLACPSAHVFFIERPDNMPGPTGEWLNKLLDTLPNKSWVSISWGQQFVPGVAEITPTEWTDMMAVGATIQKKGHFVFAAQGNGSKEMFPRFPQLLPPKDITVVGARSVVNNAKPKAVLWDKWGGESHNDWPENPIAFPGQNFSMMNDPYIKEIMEGKRSTPVNYGVNPIPNDNRLKHLHRPIPDVRGLTGDSNLAVSVIPIPTIKATPKSGMGPRGPAADFDFKYVVVKGNGETSCACPQLCVMMQVLYHILLSNKIEMTMERINHIFRSMNKRMLNVEKFLARYLKHEKEGWISIPAPTTLTFVGFNGTDTYVGELRGRGLSDVSMPSAVPASLADDNLVQLHHNGGKFTLKIDPRCGVHMPTLCAYLKATPEYLLCKRTGAVVPLHLACVGEEYELIVDTKTGILRKESCSTPAWDTSKLTPIQSQDAMQLGNMNELGALVSQWKKLKSGSKIAPTAKYLKALQDAGINTISDLRRMTQTDIEGLQVPLALKNYLRTL